MAAGSEVVQTLVLHARPQGELAIHSAGRAAESSGETANAFGEQHRRYCC